MSTADITKTRQLTPCPLKPKVCTICSVYIPWSSLGNANQLNEKNSNTPSRFYLSAVNISPPCLLLWSPTGLCSHSQPAKLIVSNLLSDNKCVFLCHTFSVSVFQQRFSLQPAPPADGCLDMMPPAQLLRKNLRAQTSPAERQTENKVTAETQAVLNITKPPAAHTTQLNTSTWKRWWLFLGPYG